VRSAPCMWRRGWRVSWLSLKTKVDGLSVVWPHNHYDGFLRFGLKTGVYGFLRFGLKIGGDGFSRFGLETGGEWFPSLGLKIGSYSLMIWDSKSPRRFFGMGLKTMRATVYRLHHKTDGRIKTVWDTCRDLAAFFTLKQVGLGFLSLASRLV
jgi:hypothetical protein